MDTVLLIAGVIASVYAFSLILETINELTKDFDR